MNAESDGPVGSRPAHIEAGGVYLPAAVCEQLWSVVRAEMARRRGEGAQIRPEMVEALTVLRAAAQAHTTAAMSVRGREPRTSADLTPWWEKQQEPMTTDQLATRLGGVTTRHARRIARAEGIAPIARNVWRPDDVAALVTRRR